MTTRFADSGVVVGFSSESNSVRSVEIRNSDMLILSIVSTVRRLFRRVLRKMKLANFMSKLLYPALPHNLKPAFCSTEVVCILVFILVISCMNGQARDFGRMCRLSKAG